MSEPAQVAFFAYLTDLDTVSLSTSVEVEASGHDMTDLLYHLLDESLGSGLPHVAALFLRHATCRSRGPRAPKAASAGSSLVDQTSGVRIELGELRRILCSQTDRFLFSFSTELVVCRRIELLELDTASLRAKARGHGEPLVAAPYALE